MSDEKHLILISSCECGQVVFEAEGEPLSSAECHCDDCRAAADSIETLPDAPSMREPNGSTALSIYLKDHIKCVKGEHLLERFKLKQDTPTVRMIAKCCNTAMRIQFDANLPWVTMYRKRFVGEKPPLKMRIYTKFSEAPKPLPDDLHNYETFPIWFPIKIMAAAAGDAITRRFSH